MQRGKRLKHLWFIHFQTYGLPFPDNGRWQNAHFNDTPGMYAAHIIFKYFIKL